MLPVYMPFTHISESTAGRINAILGPILLYQPGGLPVPISLGALVDNGLIQLYEPVEATEDDILFSLKRDYQAWAELRSNGSSIEAGAFMAHSGQVPFVDKDSSARIRTDLNKFRQGEPTEAEKNPILTARLFLALAQDHDVQTINLAKELEAVAAMEKRLMEDLKAEAPAESDSGSVQRPEEEDMGSYMTRKRIEAWSTLFLADAHSPDLFVTSSRAVIEQLCDTSEELLPIGDLDQLEKADENFHEKDRYAGSFIDYFKKLIQSADPLSLVEQGPLTANGTNEPQRRRCNCSVYLAPGISPAAFWQRYAERAFAKKKYPENSSDTLNTLIFYFESD